MLASAPGKTPVTSALVKVASAPLSLSHPTRLPGFTFGAQQHCSLPGSCPRPAPAFPPVRAHVPPVRAVSMSPATPLKLGAAWGQGGVISLRRAKAALIPWGLCVLQSATPPSLSPGVRPVGTQPGLHPSAPWAHAHRPQPVSLTDLNLSRFPLELSKLMT